jgi:hypothetical protein
MSKIRPGVTWPRLLRLLTHNRKVPMDAETRARHGTWGWLLGRDVVRLDPHGDDPASRPSGRP